MLTNPVIAESLAQYTLNLLRSMTSRIAGAFAFAGLFFLISSSAFAQQRVVIEKATGNVIDVGDKTLQYDTRYFDHMDFPASPIPAGQDVTKYRRDASGAIVLRPKDELTRGFADEWRNDLIARINNLLITPELKNLLIEIVKGISR